jgi:hypothetical protein
VSGYNTPSDPASQFAARIAALEERLRELQQSAAFRIPVVAADPDVTDPTNMWLLPDGRLRARFRNTADTAWVVKEWAPVGSPGGTSSGTAPAPPAPAPQSYTTTWTAVWSRSYRQSGAARTDDGVTMLYYGYADTFNGRNRSLIGFDHASIASALAGSTVTGVSLRLVNIHSWYNAGSTINFSIHNTSGGVAPGTWPGVVRSMIVSHKFTRGQERTVPMPVEFATSIRDGSGKGVALESPSDSADFYGRAAGVGSGYQLPQLIVNYNK